MCLMEFESEVGVEMLSKGVVTVKFSGVELIEVVEDVVKEMGGGG